MTQSERDQLRGHLDNAHHERSVAENARDESVARAVKLERTLLSRDEQLREDAERRSLQLRQLTSLLSSYHNGSFETDDDSDVTEVVRCLIQTVQDKSAVSDLCYYYLIIIVLLFHVSDSFE